MKMPPVVDCGKMSAIDFLKQAKYGVVACSWLTPNEDYTIHHFVAYLNKPTKRTIKELGKELNTDTEFGLVGRIGEDVWLQEASPEQVEYYKQLLIGNDSSGRT